MKREGDVGTVFCIYRYNANFSGFSEVHFFLPKDVKVFKTEFSCQPFHSYPAAKNHCEPCRM